MQAPAQAGDEQQERDVWWGSYAGRTMLPSFAVCVLLTAAIAAAAWYIWETHEAQPQLAREVAYAGAAAVWVIQLLRLGYRTITINYRLTTRRLFRDRGFYVPTEAVELARVTSVAVEPRALVERLVGVGRLRVVSENGTLPTFTLEGVYQPERVATEIRRWVRRAREKNKSIKAEGMFTPAVEVGRQETNKAG